VSVIHSYIYSRPGVKLDFDQSGFFYRHKLVLGILISLCFHVTYFSWSFYQWISSPFTGMSMVDDVYDNIKWIEITKLAKPLKYPANMLVSPGKVVPLDKIKEEEEKAKQRALQEAKKKAEEAKKKQQDKEDKENKKDKEDSKENNSDEDISTEDIAKNEPPQEPPPPVAQPKFGQINARPIREIMGKVYDIYKSGNLDIEKPFFAVTVGYEVEKDGSLYQVRIIKSSGSEQLDSAALNIAAAISESHALLPLTALTANTATLELGEEKASFIIRGLASNTTIASDLVSLFSQQVAGLRLLLSFKNPEAAILFNHLQISNKNNELIADMTMSRDEADEMMHRNFKKNQPQPQVQENPSQESESSKPQNTSSEDK